MKLRTMVEFGTLGVAAIALVAVIPMASAAAVQNWQLGYYTPSGNALSNGSTLNSPTSGLATFAFTSQPNTAVLFTDQGAYKGTLLGNDSGKTITAKFTIANATAGAFTYYGNPDGGSTPPSVRLFFTSLQGPFAYTNYWWTDAAATVLANGTFTLTATVDPATAWSDWNGQSSSANATAFTAAATNVTDIGLSFGGGFFFENGVGTTDGSGTFTLTSFSVS